PAQFAGVDDAFNFIEYFIHHEDVLRGDEEAGPQRELSPRESRALWKMLTRMAKVFFRRSPVGVVLRTPEGGSLEARSSTELGTVVLEGAPAELMLTAYGRRRVADLEVFGGDAAVEALWATPLGLA
ncbi:MAG: TIGR03085 family protein, partial [Pedococcus sp.]